ncbi:glycoside hydrolase family 2 TIM barrel-domain containing protein [Paenactinomyces guangxiensis]|uniref:DUF4982 domain-containing protein n=1 Tax=Paenactinomyces guangxiensis TaxID=1490290 RepID=A0A7W1WQQ5_9BACL|nr:glycoside hydrolase family 2 TIM barrel-domain containing protein [Paenactinomyces guangxiensis]MBA4494316.1 DUF4982 domain-containing protein [Paenactinomyces guangxiensis]MBH8590811.1 DUF4982 domain-containing protein [Paenactinomyces guangxiensis]
MKRKWFKRGISSGIVSALLASTLVTGMLPVNQVMAKEQPVPVDYGIKTEDSRSLDFNKGWKFALVNSKGLDDPTGKYANAQDPDYDDSDWRTLNVPHDWSIEQPPTSESPVTAGTGFFQGGLGWYRKAFTLPSAMKDKRISIDFDGVYMDSYVYVNGKLAGNHPYGYTGFSFDITDLVYTDGKTPNVIAVKVQNPVPTSRWYSGSGIYRNVHLTVTDDIHVKRWGTFVTSPNLEHTIKDGYANVSIKTDIGNQSGEARPVKLISRIKDASGKVVAQTASIARVGTKGYTFEDKMKVDDPTLWSTEKPYLYTLESDVVVNGKSVDRYTTIFGFRYFKFDPNEGFTLNGKYMKLQGVNMHHDLGALGAATNDDAVLRQMKIMKSMGVNAVRTSHNPPSPELIQVCNELGMVMIVEAFDMWENKKTDNDYSRFFKEHGERDIKEMVHAAKNWPAVVAWSIGNEIPESTQAKGVTIAQKLIDAVKSIDTTRPITIGSDKYRKLPSNGSAQDQIAQKLDLLGLNYNIASSIDELHKKYPNLVLYESESSSETSTRGVYHDPDSLNTPRNYTPGLRATSSYDNNLESWTFSGEYGLKKDRDRKYFAGQFLWTGFDYIGEPTPYWNHFPVKSSFFGAVDTAGFPKDAYYLYKSQWTKEPMVHLLPMNWTDYKPGEEVQVWAYSNVDTVELFLNGKSLGKKKFDTKKTVDGRTYLETTEATGDDKTVTDGPYPGSYTSPNGSAGKLHLTWKVPFAPGKLTAVATKDGKEVARDELETAGEPYTLKLTPDKKVITADGKSLSFVTVEVVDSKGVVVPSANNLIKFKVTGGTLAGVDNGRQESSESYKAPQREAFNGKALAIVQSTEKVGAITITATSSGLQPAVITIYSVKDKGKSEGKNQLIALEPVYMRTELGKTPKLPQTVQGIYADNTQKALSVKWDQLPKHLDDKTGVYKVKGHVRGTGIKAEAVITVYQVAGIESYSAVTAAGTAPALPKQARVVYNDGVDQFAPVTWDKIDPDQYETAGQFTVEGTVAGTTHKAKVNIRVTADYKPNANLALASGPLKATATASFSGADNTLPEAMIDGNKSSGGWSNRYSVAATPNLPAMSGARKEDYVAIKWPNPQSFGKMNMYFTTNANSSLPASLRVTYWDGSSFVPVSNLKVKWAAASNGATTISFDPVTTTQIRVDMTSKAPGGPNGHITISEFEVFGNEVTWNTTAALTDLKINGRTVAGFDADKTTYTFPAGKSMPTISASVADHGRLVIISPLTLPGTASVQVTSEDGLTRKIYEINFVKDQGRSGKTGR